MRVLLLSAYDAASHRRWREGLESHFPEYQWTQLALPPRYFNWRIRGNSLSWAFAHRHILEQEYDLLITTSMVDLSSLRGFVPALGRVPTLVYFHENQFAYPGNDRQHRGVEPQMINLYTALCADRIAFNSHYNRESFFGGVEKLLQRLPDQVPKDLVPSLRGRSTCLPVPLEASCFRGCAQDRAPLPKARTGPFQLVWNHRWEYDKGPDRLLSALQKLFPTHLNIQCHIVGQQFRQIPPAFDQIRDLLDKHNALGQWGYLASETDYRALLSSSHAVVSSALHDFQGLSVMEAVAAGCRPLVPAREAYPEWFGEQSCYTSDLDHPEREAQSLAAAIGQAATTWQVGEESGSATGIDEMAWPRLKPRYQALFESMVGNEL